MDEHTRSVYLSEIEKQCEYALNAAREVNIKICTVVTGEPNEAFRRRAVDEVFRNLHSVLTHAGTVSRLLWPTKPRKGKRETKEVYELRRKRVEDRGRTLRQLVRMLDAGHLLEKRTLRDHLEHFDERLDAWQGTSDRPLVISRGSTGPLICDQPGRYYDADTTEFTFRGEVYNFQNIVEAVEQVRDAVLASQAS